MNDVLTASQRESVIPTINVLCLKQDTAYSIKDSYRTNKQLMFSGYTTHQITVRLQHVKRARKFNLPRRLNTVW